MTEKVLAVARQVGRAWSAVVAKVPVGQQLSGAGLTAVGVWIQFGVGIAFIVAGVALAAVGTLREAGRI